MTKEKENPFKEGDVVFELDFGGHLKCQIEISNGVIKVNGAMNGWGDGIPASEIIITPLEPNHERPEPKVEFEEGEMVWFKDKPDNEEELFGGWFSGPYYEGDKDDYDIRKLNDSPQCVMDAMGVVKKGNSIETLKKLKGLLKDDISNEQLKEMLED